MFHGIHEHLERNGGNISAGQGTLHNVLGLSDGSGNNFGFNAMKFKDFRNSLDQFNAIPTDIIDTAYEGAYIGSACTGCEQCLVGREYQGHIGADSQFFQALDCFHAFRGHRNLHYHVRIQSGQYFAFFNHAFCIVSQYFSGNRAVHNGCDFLNGGMEILPFLGNQGRIGGYTGNKSHIIGLANSLYISSINKKFHLFFSFASMYIVHFHTICPFCQ